MWGPAEKAFSQHLYCRRLGIQTHFAKKGKPSTSALERQVLFSCILGKIWSNRSGWISFLCNWQAKRLDISCQICHSLTEKESKLLRSWLLDLSLQSFLLEYSRAEHGQCLCLTVQSSHCRATTRFAHVDLGAPDSGHHLYSEKSCGQIQKGASGTVTGLR